MSRFEINPKKSVHFNLTKDSHAAFRIACFQRGLSMQEVVEEFANRIATDHPHMIKLLDEVVENKKHKARKKFTKSDVESIYDLLEQTDPLKEKTNG